VDQEFIRKCKKVDLLYGDIGRDNLLRQQEQDWGAKVIEQLAHGFDVRS
jgi:hypothetical protein